MYEMMSSDEAIRLIRDGDCICVNSFVGIESPVELHEALYRRYQRMQSPRHLTVVSSAGFGVWDEERNAEGYIREGAVDRLICGHFGAMLSTKKLVLEDRFQGGTGYLRGSPAGRPRHQPDLHRRFPCKICGSRWGGISLL